MAYAIAEYAKVSGQFLLKHFVFTIFPYLFQRIRLETGTVLRKCHHFDTPYFIPGYFVEVEVCKHKDCQIVYGRDYTRRTGFVRVSRRFYNQLFRGASLQVFCQFNRGSNFMARIWVAR